MRTARLLPVRLLASRANGTSRLGGTPTRAARARRAVLSFACACVAGHVGLNVALDTVLTRWRDPEFGHRLEQLRAARSRGGGRPLLVVLGSSRTQMGVSPAALALLGADAFNLSQAGCGPVQELLNLRRLLAAGVRPDFLLVEVLPPVLAGDGPVEKLLIPRRLSLADARAAAPYCRDPDTFWRGWAASRLSPLSEHRLTIVSHLQGGWLPWQHRQDFLWKQTLPDGWMPYFHADVSPEHRAAKTDDARRQYADYFRDFRVAPLADRSYRDLLALAAEHSVRVAFVVMPESPAFRAAYPPGAWGAASAYLTQLSAAHGVPLFVARDWLPEGDFADGHHPLRRGAETLSKRLGEELVGPWVAAGRSP